MLVMPGVVWIVLAIVALYKGLFLYFFLNRKAIDNSHQKNLFGLKEQIEVHRNQIGIRSTALDRYDFLKYNLDEALLVQKVT
jgi:uncharacterized protein YneF (UPF0154 family)